MIQPSRVLQERPGEVDIEVTALDERLVHQYAELAEVHQMVGCEV